MIQSILLLILLAVLVQVVPMDGKVKHVFNLIIIVLAIVILVLGVVPWPAEWSRWPR